MSKRFLVNRIVIHNSTFSLFDAWDQVQKQKVYVFLFSPAVTEECPDLSAVVQRQFSLNTKLAHPLIVCTHTLIGHDDTLFFTEEIPEGTTLAEILEKQRRESKPLSVDTAIRIVLLLCHALQFAHRHTCHGFLHPGEIFLNTVSGYENIPRIAHFGIRANLRIAGRGLAGLSGSVAAYAAPEFLEGTPVTAQTDVYGLGALLYEMVTLHSPTGCFIRPSSIHPEVSQSLDRVILRALDEVPAARYEDVESLARELSLISGIDLTQIYPEDQVPQKETIEEIPELPRVPHSMTCRIWAWVLLVALNIILLLGALSGLILHEGNAYPVSARAKEWDDFFHKKMAKKERELLTSEVGQPLVHAYADQGSNTIPIFSKHLSAQRGGHE